jgi:uncharacterized SAM-binding protein YcdF (DUF218 family)
VVALLALAMAFQIVLITTPLMERIFDWLSVTQQNPGKADVIVCLGGRLERLLWTAEMYNRQRAPRVVVSNAPGAAEYMRSVLVDCGVPAGNIIVDNTSRTTGDHPAGVARAGNIDPHVTSILLITDHEHSRRVAAVFRKAGYEHFAIYGGRDPSFDNSFKSRLKWRVQFLPRVIYECSALVQYWWQGKI